VADPTRTQHAGESLLWAYDAAAQLAAAVTISSVTSASLTNVKTGASYPTGLSGSPSLSGTSLRQRVLGLVAGETYRLVWVFVDSAGNTQTAGLVLECPY